MSDGVDISLPASLPNILSSLHGEGSGAGPRSFSKAGWGGMDNTGETGAPSLMACGKPMFFVGDEGCCCQFGAPVPYDLEGGVGDDDSMYLEGDTGPRLEEGVHGMSTLSFDGELGREPQLGVGE